MVSSRTFLSGRLQPGNPLLLFVNELDTPGEVWFVHGTLGTNGASRGRTPDVPLQTVAYALTLAAAGDLIVCQPGHTETISTAAGINATVAGVTIVGQGHGALRPTFTMSATAATFAINAADVRLRNLLFLATAQVVIGLDVNAARAVIEECEWRDSTDQFTTAIDIGTGGSANACDRTTISGCTFYSIAVGGMRAIELGEVAAHVTIEGCLAVGDYDDAAIHNPTGKVLTHLLIKDCILRNLQTGDHALELVSACTGMLVRNMYASDMTQETAVDPGSCFSFQCFHDDVIDKSGVLAPAAT